MAHLDAVFRRLADRGFTINPDKCEFFKTSIVFLSHQVDGTGMRPLAASEASPEVPGDDQLLSPLHSRPGRDSCPVVSVHSWSPYGGGVLDRAAVCRL